MTTKVKDKVVKVTVLSAVTIITFAGNAALIIPNSTVSANQDFSAIASSPAPVIAGDTIEIQANISEKLFEAYSQEGIRNKIDKASEWKLNSDILEYLDISAVEAVEATQSGKTFRDIAIDKNKSVEEVANIFEDSLRYKLDKKFEAGKISYERYTNLINNLDSIRVNFINGVY